MNVFFKYFYRAVCKQVMHLAESCTLIFLKMKWNETETLISQRVVSTERNIKQRIKDKDVEHKGKAKIEGDNNTFKQKLF